MKLISRCTSTRTTTCLFSLLLSLYILLCYTDVVDQTAGWSTFYLSIIPIVGAFGIAALVVVAVKTTILTWITVLVILAFAGKRRRVLVVQGRKITSDVAKYLFTVVMKERSILAVACATVVSSMAVAWVY